MLRASTTCLWKWAALAVVVTAAAAGAGGQPPFRPDIPKVWDEAAIADMEIPLPPPAPKPSHVSEAYYEAIPEITIYKMYPRTPPRGSTPESYLDWLNLQEPVVAFDSATLQTRDDWIAAGALVFRTTLRPSPYQPNAGSSFVIRKKGTVESTIGTCASCHSQRQADGTFLYGAPSLNANLFARADFSMSSEQQHRQMRALFSTPWRNPDPNMALDAPLTRAEVDRWNIPPAVTHRTGTSLHYPLRIPSLIGVEGRKYFDTSGRHRHRSIGDLMRYAALADISFGLESYQRYGDFIPGADDFRTLPDPKALVRFSDAQLYALALYLYSLAPPPNPNTPTAASAAGEQVFRREGCAACHTPPLYTNNKLVPADGFVIPPVLEHNGSVTTLEEWLDPGRLNEDFVPSGFKGPHKTRAVKGHPFGLTLSATDKEALIAFLRTL